jgi:hypothetical protein
MEANNQKTNYYDDSNDVEFKSNNDFIPQDTNNINNVTFNSGSTNFSSEEERPKNDVSFNYNSNPDKSIPEFKKEDANNITEDEIDDLNILFSRLNKNIKALEKAYKTLDDTKKTIEMINKIGGKK